MFALLPSTLGLGSAALWLHSLNWPLTVDEAGLTLRNRRQMGWVSVEKIGLSRSYLDGHVSQLRIHFDDGGVSKIPVRALHDGQTVVKTILTNFKRMAHASNHSGAPDVAEFPERDVTKLTQELTTLLNAWAEPAPKTQRMTELERERT
jgi:hypothetical protein